MRYWVNEVIEKKDLIPHASDYYPGYRIFIPEVNLILEASGRYFVGSLWKTVYKTQSGDEIINISKAEFTTI